MSPISALLTCLVLSMGVAEDQPVYKIDTRKFAIPIKVDPARRDEMDRLVLFRSSDLGKTWQQVATVAVSAKFVPCETQADGEYWFNIQVIWKNGQAEPSDFSDLPPGQRVVVETRRKVDTPVSALPFKDKEIEEIKVELKSFNERLSELVDGLHRWYMTRARVKRLLERIGELEGQRKNTTQAQVQLAGYYRFLAEIELKPLASDKAKSLEERERIGREYQRWMQKAADEYLELTHFLEKPESKNQLTEVERLQIPFIGAECLFNLAKFAEAHQVFDHLAKIHAGKVQGLDALKGCIRCLAAQRQYDKVRQRLQQIRSLLNKVDSPDRKLWEEWLTEASNVLMLVP